MRCLIVGCSEWCFDVYKQLMVVSSTVTVDVSPMLVPILGERLSEGVEWRFVGNKESLDRMNKQEWDEPFQWTPRIIFFLHWSWKVPQSIWAKRECINFHCTPLPYGRGGHPIENLILAGHTETVITAHRITEDLDAGPIYLVSEPVSLAGNKAEIQARFIQPVAAMIRHIVRFEPEPKAQVGQPTYFKRLPPAEYEAFWKAREPVHG